jgi:hypothetical protein
MSDHLPPIPVADIARIGPYFAFTSTPRPANGFRPVRALLADADAVGGMIDDLALRLGTAQRWIAASIFYQAWAARLTSIYAGSAALCGAVPDLRAAFVSYRLPRHGPVQLNVAPLRSLTPPAGWQSLRDQHLDPLAAAIRGQVRIGSYLLVGNIGSALAGTLGIITAERGQSLGSLLGANWTHPAGLRTSGRWLRTPDGPRYARRTCCGYEQLDQAGRCGDCSLNWHGQQWPALPAPQPVPAGDERRP